MHQVYCNYIYFYNKNSHLIQQGLEREEPGATAEEEVFNLEIVRKMLGSILCTSGSYRLLQSLSNPIFDFVF